MKTVSEQPLKTIAYCCLAGTGPACPALPVHYCHAPLHATSSIWLLSGVRYACRARRFLQVLAIFPACRTHVILSPLTAVRISEFLEKNICAQVHTADLRVFHCRAIHFDIDCQHTFVSVCYFRVLHQKHLCHSIYSGHSNNFLANNPFSAGLSQGWLDNPSRAPALTCR